MSSAPGSHRWWIFDGRHQFESRAASLFDPASARGHRLAVVSEAPDAHRWPGHMLDSGRLELVPSEDLYREVFEADADGRRAIIFDALARAIADGYSGLTVIADASALVTQPGDPYEFLEWERLVDDFAAVEPLDVLCAFDSRALSLWWLGPLLDHHAGGMDR
jgi:MEDS: MEthanogen/methylotroph, DcmR Sensory domain